MCDAPLTYAIVPIGTGVTDHLGAADRSSVGLSPLEGNDPGDVIRRDHAGFSAPHERAIVSELRR